MNHLVRGCALLIGGVQLTFGPVAVGLASESVSQADEQKTDQPAVASIATIERGLGGRLGVAVLDTGGGRRLEYHAGDRFPVLSTFKFLAAAAVLQKVRKKEFQLDRKISYSPPYFLNSPP